MSCFPQKRTPLMLRSKPLPNFLNPQAIRLPSPPMEAHFLLAQDQASSNHLPQIDPKYIFPLYFSSRANSSSLASDSLCWSKRTMTEFSSLSTSLKSHGSFSPSTLTRDRKSNRMCLPSATDLDGRKDKSETTLISSMTSVRKATQRRRTRANSSAVNALGTFP
ncbi:hypothetical protein CYLTODRAFT_426933 [Cylindrobasidium torrendii FP15055 ss-10]|uniref:Uncharacterized protein n=1 Tax=Cylindrobasidium torrendii FP15055 ss-10 TaxID=1314674 RepID=A0A0D7AWN4_9AGAR|nr:hypothetical protein CYLTODRAFT_426933 [Cylindrobasidium torrendii FP15055 ss-10]